MRKHEAYRIGLAKGEEFVSQYSYGDIIEQAKRHSVNLLDVFGVVASETFESYSQYSPWEFTAKALNDSRYPDKVWAAFNDGMSKGAMRAGKAIIKAYEAAYKAEHPFCIMSLSALNVSESWESSSNPNMGCAVLTQGYDGETIKAQYSVAHGDGEWATPLRKYKVQYSMSAKDIDGYPSAYFRIAGMTVWIDELTWRGGSISACQQILADNGTIKAGL